MSFRLFDVRPRSRPEPRYYATDGLGGGILACSLSTLFAFSSLFFTFYTTVRSTLISWLDSDSWSKIDLIWNVTIYVFISFFLVCICCILSKLMQTFESIVGCVWEVFQSKLKNPLWTQLGKLTLRTKQKPSVAPVNDNTVITPAHEHFLLSLTYFPTLSVSVC